MKLHVKYLDGSEAEVVATASALRALEARHNQSLLAAMGTYKSYWADELVFDSVMQAAGTKPTADEWADAFDEWLDTVEAIRYELPAGSLVQLAEALGVRVTADDVAEVTPTPSGGAAKGRSPAGSSTPRSTRGKASKS